MPFGIFSSRWAGVLTGRITKKQRPAEPSDAAKLKSAYQKPAVSGLLSPPLTVKVVRDDVVIKTEEVDSEDEDEVATPTRDQKAAGDSRACRDHDILPSVERSASPEDVDMILLPSIETSLLGRLRGGKLGHSDGDSDEAEFGSCAEDGSEQGGESFEPEASPDFPAGHWNIPAVILDQYEDLRNGVVSVPSSEMRTSLPSQRFVQCNHANSITHCREGLRPGQRPSPICTDSLDSEVTTPSCRVSGSETSRASI